MALDLNAFAVLRIVGEHASLFPDVRKEAGNAARALIVKQIKAKGTDLAALRALRHALGSENFGLVVDGMKDTELKTVASRLDKHNPDLKTANPAGRRRHLLALADGGAEPATKPEKPTKKTVPKASKAKKTKEPEFLDDDSAGALRKR